MNIGTYKPRNFVAETPATKTKKVERYLELAKNMANQSTYGKIKHGAVLVKGGSIINAAYNKDSFSSFGSRFRKHDCGHATHHAELGCVLGIDRAKTAGATVYVVRINNEGKYRLSKPCSMCHEVLKFCGIKKVVYTVNEEEIASYKL